MAENQETITYLGTHWLQVDDTVITIGLNEEGIEAADEISKIDLPGEGEAVETDEICGELETTDGPINIFAPVSGTVLEINPSVVENPELIKDDPYGEGWLIKIEVENTDEINELVNGTSYEH